jgi:4-aminobutyrate aminotransferase
VGQALLDQLHQLADRQSAIGDVRGKGLMVGVELVKHGKPDPALRDAVVNRCFEKGLLLLGCGSTSVRFSPPLIIGASEVQTAVSIFDESLRELE